MGGEFSSNSYLLDILPCLASYPVIGCQSNVGQCSILIHSDAVNEVELDIQKLMNTTNGSAMSVEINDCIFRKNAALFGTISNIGGFVSVYKTLFDENFAMVSRLLKRHTLY